MFRSVNAKSAADMKRHTAAANAAQLTANIGLRLSDANDVWYGGRRHRPCMPRCDVGDRAVVSTAVAFVLSYS